MIEQTNEIVHKMNSLLPTSILSHCKALLSETSRLPGIDGNAKMSKSLGNTLLLSASEEAIHHAVSAMYTDPNHLKVSDPGRLTAIWYLLTSMLFIRIKQKWRR